MAEVGGKVKGARIGREGERQNRSERESISVSVSV